VRRPAARSLTLLALTIALAIAIAPSLALGPRDAAAFMRPAAPAIAAPSPDGTYTCAALDETWTVRLSTLDGIVSGTLFSRDSREGSAFNAVGLVRDGRLVMAIDLARNGGGFAYYRFTSGGARGEYSHFSSHRWLGEELISDGPPVGPAGVYHWIARSPAETPAPLGTGGQGTLEITTDGPIVRFDWRNGLQGVGVRSGGTAIVGWGTGGAHAAVSLAPTHAGWSGLLAASGSTGAVPLTLTRVP
jgi:hypothetical protein